MTSEAAANRAGQLLRELDEQLTRRSSVPPVEAAALVSAWAAYAQALAAREQLAAVWEQTDMQRQLVDHALGGQ